MRITMGCGIVGILYCLASASAAVAAQGPSFNCAKAQSDVEKAICGDKKLQGADRMISEHFNRLRRTLPPEAAKALTADQKNFIYIRDSIFSTDFEDIASQSYSEKITFLQDILSRRISFLASVRSEKSGGLPGHWANANGNVDITDEAGGKLSVKAVATEQLAARWMCESAGDASAQGNEMEINDAEAPDWKLRLARDGAVLHVTEVSPSGGPEQSPFCGMNGTLSGNYFPIVEN